MISRAKPMKIGLVDAAGIASEKLGRKVTYGAIRQWRHRGFLAGGNGWVDGADLLHFCDHPERWPGSGLPQSRPGDTPMIARTLAQCPDLL